MKTTGAVMDIQLTDTDTVCLTHRITAGVVTATAMAWVTATAGTERILKI
jgi:hypothetical protein